MRIVVLASSVYSETACAMAVRLAEAGYDLVGALSLSTANRRTLVRKVGQLGMRGAVSYARSKLIPHRNHGQSYLQNRYLEPILKCGHGFFRSLREVAALHHFPVAVCDDQNAPDSIIRLKGWSPDLIIFTGGNILRKQLLDLPRLGVLNVHLALLPEVRGMSTPEWSLLTNVPVGITIHYMDAGIDTGPILQRYELPDASMCESLSDLRHRLITFGVEKIADAVGGLDHGTISPTPQTNLDRDSQFFAMHEWLRARAGERLTLCHQVDAHGTAHG